MKLSSFGDKQIAAILDSKARINILDGSVRSGKTIASIIRFLSFVAETPTGAILAVGKTERTLKRNILDVIAEIVSPEDFRLVSGSGECFIYGRKIYLAGANDERSEGKIRGMTLAGAYGDELTLWPETFFAMLLSRLSVPGAQLFGTTNPDSPAHWLMKNYLTREDELDLRRFQFRLEDNPALDPAYVGALKREYTGLWYRRFIEGAWCVAEGAVYDLFDPAKHVVNVIPAIREYFVGCDYGTANDFVALLAGVGVDDRLYIIDEWRHASRTVGRQMTDAEYSREVQAWLARHNVTPRWIFIDPSAASFILQLRRDGVRNLAQADNAVLDGIRNVATLLDRDRLKIHEGCKGLIDEIYGYSWDSAAQARGEDKPMKVSDHGCDAARYLTNGTQHIWRRWLRAERKAA